MEERVHRAMNADTSWSVSDSCLVSGIGGREGEDMDNVAILKREKEQVLLTVT